MCNIICQLEPEKGQGLSVAPFVKLIFFHMTTNNHIQCETNHKLKAQWLAGLDSSGSSSRVHTAR